MAVMRVPILQMVASVLACTALAPQQSLSETPCADRSVAAGAITTPEEVIAFANCAYEYVLEHGTGEARRAFNEDDRWKSGQFYIYVASLTPRGEDSVRYVFPPDPSMEGSHVGGLTDSFGPDLVADFYRIGTDFGGGWVYYAFANPETGKSEPKAAYFRVIDWNGTPSLIGSGIYQRDLPSTCDPEQVNASAVRADPSIDRLREFVRRASLHIRENGYGAVAGLENDGRWRDQEAYLFGMDLMGNQLFSGSPTRVNGSAVAEWPPGGGPTERLGDRDGVAIIETSSESPLTWEAQLSRSAPTRLFARRPGSSFREAGGGGRGSWKRQRSFERRGRRIRRWNRRSAIWRTADWIGSGSEARRHSSGWQGWES